MKTESPIVAAVDFSSSSGQVLRHAAKWSGATGAPLIVAHVVSESRLRDWAETMHQEVSAGNRAVEVEGRLMELLAETCPGVEARIEIRVGRPYPVLEEVVLEHGAEVLILGAHDVSKRRLGSLAGRCARSIPADVLILRDWQGKLFDKIAVAVDYSASSANALRRAITLAGIHGASLEIIHVMFPPNRDPWGKVLEGRLDEESSYETVVRERESKRLEEFLAPFADRLATLPTQKLCMEGESPSAAITAHVQAAEIDLTVMGSHGASWVEDFVLGSNTERLMHDSTSSVLITRARNG